MKTQFIGSAYGIGAGTQGCGEGPRYLQKYLQQQETPLATNSWKMIEEKEFLTGKDKYQVIAELNKAIGHAARHTLSQHQFPINIGGDHSCAIGMWSALSHFFQPQGDIGLIWIDAHLDAHTPTTSKSGNIHGMPAACLLGHGDRRLTHLFSKHPAIKPENLCLIGIRDFEQEEQLLLESMGVKIYFIEDVRQKSFPHALQEAIDDLSQRTTGLGITLDIDAIEPKDAPAVGTPSPDGILAKDLLAGFNQAKLSIPLRGLEITEYNPHLDQGDKTAALILEILSSNILRQ